jgi:hypothetical protein
MNERNEENLEQDLEDVQKAEQILRENPAPQPSEELIADIKTEITTALLRRQSNAYRRIIYKAVAVAAVLIILVAIGLRVFEEDGDRPERVIAASIIPNAIWESDCLADDDVDLAILTAEIEQIQAEVMALQLGGNGGNGSRAITELEMELIEINSDFWKG